MDIIIFPKLTVFLGLRSLKTLRFLVTNSVYGQIFVHTSSVIFLEVGSRKDILGYFLAKWRLFWILIFFIFEETNLLG